ncbi:MAG: ATP synthase F0 subunit B [Acidobacteria bacterium]|nr:ATP synthase F0 subunit B [Acidobacteriota bacterium]
MALMELANLGWAAPASGGGSGLDVFLGQLPDPMRPYLWQLLFVIALVTALHWILKLAFYKPISKVMSDREDALSAGSDTKAKAAVLVEARQREYREKLKDLRARAAAHRKALADAAGAEKQALVDAARTKATAQRKAAMEALVAETAQAKQDLVAQADQLAETMAARLMARA